MIQPKSKDEIKKLREGGRRLANILQELSSVCEPGLAVRSLNERADKLISSEDSPAFFGYQPSGAARPYPDKVCVSVNDAIVHGIPSESDHTLASGDIVSVDMGLEHKDLITDSALSFVVGESAESKNNLLAACQAALQAGIQAAQPGTRVGDISAAIQDAVDDQYAIFRPLVGHGVGYEVHEDPTVPNVGQAGTGPEIPAGTVLALEPMIGMGTDQISQDDDGYTYRTNDGSLSAHFEHTIVVTENGPEILTQQ